MVDDLVPKQAEPPACPLPLTHDRLTETHWHLHQMLEHYHHPDAFRYSTNAFLHALKSVVDMLRIDMEKLQQNEWRKRQARGLIQDPLFSAFSKGRDVVVHQGALVEGSTVELGLFKFGKLKMAMERNLRTDQPSHSLLELLITVNDNDPLFVDREHGFIGEQLGVRRMYFEPKLHVSDDVVTAAGKAYGKAHALVADAHKHLGFGFDSEHLEPSRAHDVERVNLFQETDLDPSLVEKWQW